MSPKAPRSQPNFSSCLCSVFSLMHSLSFSFARWQKCPGRAMCIVGLASIKMENFQAFGYRSAAPSPDWVGSVGALTTTNSQDAAAQ